MKEDNDYAQSRSFNLGVAIDTSIESALIYDELAFWSNKGHREDGWVYKTLDELSDRLPIKPMTIRRGIEKLVEKGYIEKKVMKAYGTPTMHFRLLKSLSVVQNDQMDLSKMNNSIESNKMNKSIYTATNTATNNKEDELNKQINGIISKRRKLKWATPYGGSKKEPQVAKHLLDLDDYSTILRVMEYYEKNREDRFMPKVSNIDDLYHKYRGIKDKMGDDYEPQPL